MINKLPVTNSEIWLPKREGSILDYYFTLGREALYGITKLDDYRHNKYDIDNCVEGIEIRWNYNIFENE